MPRSAAGKQPAHRATAALAGELPQTWPVAAGGSRRRTAAAQLDLESARPGLFAPPLRPSRQPALVISHLPKLGGQLGRHGVHPGVPLDRKASIDEEVTPDLTNAGALRGEE